MLPSRALPLASAAESLAGVVAAAGVKIRACPGHGVRISVGEAKAHRVLLAALGRADRGQWA